MFGTEWTIQEEFEPIEPWNEFESRWFESIREAMKKIEDGKRDKESNKSRE